MTLRKKKSEAADQEARDEKVAGEVAKNEFEGVHAEMRAAFRRGSHLGVAARVAALDAVGAAVRVHYEGAVRALAKDLGRSRTEAEGELQLVLAEVSALIRGLTVGQWAAPEAAPTHLLLAPAYTEIRREPFGVVLVIGPFNYPLNLCLVPMLGALAAGNTVVVKPSEVSSACADWLINQLGPALPTEAVRFVSAGVAQTGALLALQWDFLFFTGSPRVGRIVSGAAAKHLTPTVMELGGKAPVYVDASASSLVQCARRVVLGKLINAGQTCMAPDYLLVHEAVEGALLQALVDAVAEFYGSEPRDSPDFGRMCTQRHAQRMVSLLEGCEEEAKGASAGGGGGVRVLCGGAARCDVAARYVAPTVVRLGPAHRYCTHAAAHAHGAHGVCGDALGGAEARRSATPGSSGGGGGVGGGVGGGALLREEVFGPILGVATVKNAAEAVAAINAIDPQPLALYLFCGDAGVREAVLGGVQSGDALINDTFLHTLSPAVPFGGIGTSGHGTYRGRYSFEAFTYRRGVVVKSGRFCIDQVLPFLRVRYPPGGRLRELLLPRLVVLLPSVPRLLAWPSPRALGCCAAACIVLGVVLGAEHAQQPPLSFAADLCRAYSRAASGALDPTS